MQTCEDLGASLFVHPWDMAMGGRYSKYWLPWLVGMPAETATAICCLLMGGVLHRSRVSVSGLLFTPAAASAQVPPAEGLLCSRWRLLPLHSGQDTARIQRE